MSELERRGVLVIQCGGAIDLDYPSRLHGYHFQVTQTFTALC
jgi:hypothetical protein